MSTITNRIQLDVNALLEQLTLDEKVELLAGQGSFRTTGLPRRGIPALIVRSHALMHPTPVTTADDVLVCYTDFRWPPWHPWTAFLQPGKCTASKLDVEGEHC